jgi:hypothetical protein
MRSDMSAGQLPGMADGAWRLATADEVALLSWGLRQRERFEQAHTLLLQLYGPRVARVTIAATRGEEAFDDENYGYGGLQPWRPGQDWRAYEDQPFRATDAAGNLLDVDLTLPSWRVEAEHADTTAAQAGAGSWRRKLAPDLAREAARSATRDWTALDQGDRAFFVWREFICDVLRAARVTLPGDVMAFDFTAPPPVLEGALAVRVELLKLLEALVAGQARRTAEGEQFHAETDG